MKTILIPIFDGTIAKNILRTSVLKTLVDSGARLVLVPPAGKADYYKAEFASERVVIETGYFWRERRIDKVVGGLFLHSIPTNFMRIRQVDWYWNQHKYVRYCAVSILRILGRFEVWKAFLRSVAALQPVPGHVREVFDRWDPDLVFAPTMIPSDEVFLMRLALKCGKKVVGMPKSWDNLTSKAFLRVMPDVLICHNEIMGEEAERIYKYPRERIVVTGIPQYDGYIGRALIQERQEFFEEIGADPGKKLILYAPAGDWMNPYDKEIVEVVLGAIERGEVPDATILLRLHPAYESRTEELAGRPNIIVERPGVFTGKSLKTYEFEQKDVRRLANSIAHSDLVINTASTMTIEAAIFDKPVVLIGFDQYSSTDYWKSVARYYDREHYVPIVRSGGARLVQSPEDLIVSIRRYLDDPSCDSSGRKKIVDEECYRLDGKAGERIGKLILNTARISVKQYK